MLKDSILKIQKLFIKRSSSEVMKEAFKIICPQKTTWMSCLVFSIISISIAIIIGSSSDTVQLFYNSVEIFNTVILAIFGIVFTGYVFFQALLNNELLKRLIDADSTNKFEKIEKGTKSLLQESNEYFVYLTILNIIEIIINVILLILIGSIPNDFIVFSSLVLNNIIACIGISIYYSFSFLILWEMKCFIYNIFQLFNAHAGAKAIEIMKNEEDSTE